MEKEFKEIVEFRQYVLNNDINGLAERIGKIDGIATNATKIAKGIVEKWDYIVELSFEINLIDITNAGPLANRSYAITGDLSIPRNDMFELIQKNGGITKSSVSKGLDYLITNQLSESIKSKKAISLGIKVISEAQLMELINGPSNQH